MSTIKYSPESIAFMAKHDKFDMMFDMAEGHKIDMLDTLKKVQFLQKVQLNNVHSIPLKEIEERLKKEIGNI